MIHASMFSGFGGFDLAAEWMGWETAFQCESDPFCQKILNFYWPNIKCYDDITKTDFSIWRGKIDVLSGGPPCQPYSSAGKRQGESDPRHLWPEMYRAVQEIAPKFVLVENVTGMLNWDGGVVFEDICLDLEYAGYEVTPIVLPAASIGAPHLRYRIFFVAYSSGNGLQSRKSGKNRQEKGKGKRQRNKRKRIWNDGGGVVQQGLFTDTDKSKASVNDRLSTIPVQQRGVQSIRGRQPEQLDQNDEKGRTLANTYSEGLEDGVQGSKQARWGQLGDVCGDQNWVGFPTQSPVRSRNDGVSSQLDNITFPKWRSESIKGYGNAVVPGLILQFFKSMEQLHSN